MRLKLSTLNGGVYFGSDFHFRHNKEFIYESRGFKSIGEHDEAILNDIRKLTADDTLIYLGDFALNSSVEEVDALMDEFKCKVIFVWGNHESYTEKIYRRELVKLLGEVPKETYLYPLYYKNFMFVGNLIELSIDKQKVIACHYPLASWNHMAHGAGICHGHEHQSEIRSWWTTTNQGKIADIGVDACLTHVGRTIVSWDELKPFMDAKKIASVGHH